MRNFFATLGIWLFLILLHYPLLSLPFYWDEAGYYAIASLDFYRHGLLIPQSTWPTGHTPLVPAIVGTAWHLFGVSPSVARTTLLLLAAATVMAAYRLARRILPLAPTPDAASGEAQWRSNWEPAAWAAALLAVSPLFFAQSDMLHIDLAAALFTMLALIALLPPAQGSRVSHPESRISPWLFPIAASLAILSKETSVILLPVAWAYAWLIRRERRPATWLGLAFPLLPLALWTLGYHHVTGFWTGNGEYLKYNLYSTLNPVRFVLSLMRRFYQLFIGGFDWLLVLMALAGYWRSRRKGDTTGWKAVDSEAANPSGCHKPDAWRNRLARVDRFTGFLLLAGSLTGVSLLFHSLVGGALLRRYLLPVFPIFFLCAVGFIWQLPKRWARGLCLLLLGFLISSWFINPPYPFAFEDNLAYADFIRLHQEASRYLEQNHAEGRILTAWPATGELTTPFLRYVTRPLQVVPVDDFTPSDFARVNAESFDLLYLYSRKWEPGFDLLRRFPALARLQQRYFDYAPATLGETLASRYHLRPVVEFRRRGQWVRIYAK